MTTERGLRVKDDIAKSPPPDRPTPFDPSFEKKMSKAEDIMARYRNTLHALATRSAAPLHERRQSPPDP